MSKIRVLKGTLHYHDTETNTHHFLQKGAEHEVGEDFLKQFPSNLFEVIDQTNTSIENPNQPVRKPGRKKKQSNSIEENPEDTTGNMTEEENPEDTTGDMTEEGNTESNLEENLTESVSNAPVGNEELI